MLDNANQDKKLMNDADAELDKKIQNAEFTEKKLNTEFEL